MSSMREKICEIYSLEQLSSGCSVVHAVHPFVKLVSTLVYIVCVVSFGRYELSGVVPYIFYPVIAIACAEIPLGMILRRAAIALPFCLLAGISNLIFDRAILLNLGTVGISYGFVSLLAILLRTLLCVSAVLILIAVTPFEELGAELRRLKVPDMLVMLLEMTYRYIGVLLGEASSMIIAHKLRGGGRGVELMHMGGFAGQLLIRSFDRAERVSAAMKCRGYPRAMTRGKRRGLSARDICFFAAVSGSSLLFRFFDITGIFEGLLGGLL